ncbi:MAG: hypothetical protein IT458_15120 [Planctomycetes bacterium]|nr:hypothetical protein [Planctomycetota bacterium]
MSGAPKVPAVLLGCVALAAAGGAALWWGRAADLPPAPAPPPPAATRPAPATQPITAEAPAVAVPPVAFLTSTRAPSALHVRSPHPPGTRIPVRSLPRVDNGIPLPDGTFLPFLNGMTWAPKLHRDPARGPVPPVVEKFVDAAGLEWWVHADGSATTSCYHQVSVGNDTYWDPATRHGTPQPASEILPPGEPGTRPGAR